jgi:hypothetical protein
MAKIDILDYERALVSAMNQTPDGLSMVELMDIWKLRLPRTRERVQALVKSGALRHNGFRQETRIDGRAKEVPVYILVKQKTNRK